LSLLARINQLFNSIFLSQQISISINSSYRNDQPNRAIIRKEPQYREQRGRKEGSTITGEKAWPKGTDAELPKGACVAIASASELQGMGRVTMQRLKSNDGGPWAGILSRPEVIPAQPKMSLT
jgi:hypothetical protein